MIIPPFENLNNLLTPVNQTTTESFILPLLQKGDKKDDPFNFIKVNYVTKKASYKKVKLSHYVQK